MIWINQPINRQSIDIAWEITRLVRIARTPQRAKMRLFQLGGAAILQGLHGFAGHIVHVATRSWAVGPSGLGLTPPSVFVEQFPI